MNPQFPQNDSPNRPTTSAAQYKFTPEEVQVIKECNRESFYQRCVPIGTVLGLSTFYGVQSGYLKGNAKWGAAPKVAVSVLVGYFLGKLSYQTRCAEKLMQLPNSQVGEMLRKRRSGNVQETLEPGFGPGLSLSPFSSGISSADVYTDLEPRGSVDIDTRRPQYDGLDDSHRPSLDNPMYEEEMPPEQKHITTYDELRKQNREEYQQKRTGNFRERSAPSPAAPPAAPARPNLDLNSSLPKNRYGDVVE